ncbi:hypothetical protein IBE48_04930 [Francisella philomiragia]|uniref:Lipoprotein n=1 Tax=Francisella philomiragia TaxID=28110 RepID=A0AAW3D9W3_9GAMM|nr:hypothetical protein [Francisella philomiragia]KFJ42365.1 putative lipoprotein [Francisella philomiragia]MBK2254011.1 hypothetical protein [Francisella philomiragia]MBK2272323.1 hypothetical protein [Francisella philomiragia]MBK2276165.1 hypothetical protein [Francisella philomiragia]MBK2280112.1 hypothetical protein [Francisella philomiragia]
MKKILIIIFCVLLLSSCAKEVLIGDKLTDKATDKQQEQFKENILELFENQYNQPFKISDFKYEYGTHWKDKSCVIASMCPKEIYGTYSFYIEAIKNPIIKIKLVINDKKGSLEFIKNHFIDTAYCSSLADYYLLLANKNAVINQKGLDIGEKYCDSIGQDFYKKGKKVYLKSLNK